MVYTTVSGDKPDDYTEYVFVSRGGVRFGCYYSPTRSTTKKQKKAGLCDWVIYIDYGYGKYYGYEQRVFLHQDDIPVIIKDFEDAESYLHEDGCH